MWQHSSDGQGMPLVLLHGIGMSRRAFAPVIPRLAQQRRVLAFDLPGFGETPALEEAPTPQAYARHLARTLSALGIDYPVDVVGNSLGGAIALEAAKLGYARTVVALSPAGLWRDEQRRAKLIFFVLRKAMHWMPAISRAALSVSWLRELLLAVPMTTGCRKMSSAEAIATAEAFAHCADFERVLEHVTPAENGPSITVPITVAFGTRDWVIPPSARRRDMLPSNAAWHAPKGWGHVPMWRDPEAVADFILTHTAPDDARSRLGS